MATGFANPLRSYRFKVEIDGLDTWAVQKITMPEREVSVVEHGGESKNIKTPSKEVIGNMTMEKLKPLEKTDKWSYEWMKECLLLLPSASKRNMVISELGNDGITVINRHILTGVFPIKSSMTDLDRMADTNTVETVEFSVDDYELL